MKIGIRNPSGLSVGERWRHLALEAGHELSEAGDVEVLCVFGGLPQFLKALEERSPPARRLVWWCSQTPFSSPATRLLKRLSPPLEVLTTRLGAVDEVLVPNAATAEALTALFGLQATVVKNTDDTSLSRALDEACRRAVGLLPSSARDPFVPRVGHVLPYSVSHDVPGFTVPESKQTYVFSPEPVRSEDWFNAFADRIEASLGKSFLPICRMSDGEYLFRFGWQPHLPNEPLLRRTGAHVRHAAGLLRPNRGFRAGHSGRYQSARYTLEEQREGHAKFDAAARFLSERGILALHLSHERRSFQERFYPSVASWLRELELPLTTRNYVPFYFVYALLTGPRRHSILSGRRVLVVNGATGEKRERIIEGLRREGAEVVHWESISAARSLFDVVDVSAWRGRVDLALVGAGIGKVNVLPQLEVLGVPCIDAGYVFEVWADPSSSRERFYCEPDRPAAARSA